MARMPGALWIGPTPNSTENGMSTIKGLVLHIEQGYESGSEAWFKNPDARASAHFLNPKTGPLRQMVDTRDRAWAQAAGNPNWISVEHEGFVPDALTPSQVENDAQLFAWVCRTYAVPVQSTDSPAWRGLGWHGMGGDLWGGHPRLPGRCDQGAAPGDPDAHSRAARGRHQAHPVPGGRLVQHGPALSGRRRDARPAGRRRVQPLQVVGQQGRHRIG
jgi:hypothetical protein